jgi:hypothetical protein
MLTLREQRIQRIASKLIKADLFDGKPEYIYDPKHEMSKAEVERKVREPVHPTPKGWGIGKKKDKSQGQMDLFNDIPPSIIETTPKTETTRSVDLFGNPIPKKQEILPPPKQEEIPVTPSVVKPIEDKEGQQELPIGQNSEPVTQSGKFNDWDVVEPYNKDGKTYGRAKNRKTGESSDFLLDENLDIVEPVEHPVPSIEPPKPVTNDSDNIRNAVKMISRRFGTSKVLESVPKSMLSSIGGKIRKFDEKGMDAEMHVQSPDGNLKSIVVKHNMAPVNDMDRDMQMLHALGASWAISSGLSDDEAFQNEAKKAWTKDMDNFVSRYTDLPMPAEEFKTISPANWIAKGYSSPQKKEAFYKMFAGTNPSKGDKNALMVRSFIGAMEVASDGEYGYGTPFQSDNGPDTKVSNMAGYMAQNYGNPSGFIKKNMPNTYKLFSDKMGV